MAKSIVLQPFGEVQPPKLQSDTPLIPSDLVLGTYPDDLDAACRAIESLLKRRRRPGSRLVVIVSDDLRIAAGCATARGMAALLKRYGPENEAGRYVHGCYLAWLRDDIEKTADSIIGARG